MESFKIFEKCLKMIAKTFVFVFLVLLTSGFSSAFADTQNIDGIRNFIFQESVEFAKLNPGDSARTDDKTYLHLGKFDYNLEYGLRLSENFESFVLSFKDGVKKEAFKVLVNRKGDVLLDFLYIAYDKEGENNHKITSALESPEKIIVEYSDADKTMQAVYSAGEDGIFFTKDIEIPVLFFLGRVHEENIKFPLTISGMTVNERHKNSFKLNKQLQEFFAPNIKKEVYFYIACRPQLSKNYESVLLVDEFVEQEPVHDETGETAGYIYEGWKNIYLVNMDKKYKFTDMLKVSETDYLEHYIFLSATVYENKIVTKYGKMTNFDAPGNEPKKYKTTETVFSVDKNGKFKKK